MKLNDKLQNNDLYPFHMPGHKRNKNFNIPASEIDITEIDGFDNLHSPPICLMKCKEISKLFGAKKHNKC